MIQRNFILGVIVTVAIATPITAAYVLEKQTERFVTKTLRDNRFQVTEVNYNYAEEVLDIYGLAGSIPHVENGKFSAERITLIRPNTEAFDDDAGDYPLVAQEIIVDDFASSYTAYGEEVSSNTEEMHIVGWKQNLPRLLTSHTTDEFIAAMLNVYVDFVTMRNSQGSSTFEGMTSKSLIQQATINGITPHSIGTSSLQNISAVLTDKNIANEEIRTNIAAVEIGSMDMPSESFVTFLLNYAIQATKKPLDGAKEKEFEQHLHNYFANGAKPALAFRNISIKKAQDKEITDLFSLGAFNLTAKYDAIKAANLDFALNIKDLAVTLPTLPETAHLQKLLNDILGTKSLQISTDIQGKMLTMPNNSALSASFGIKDLGALKFELDAVLPLKSFATVMTVNVSEQALQALLAQLAVQKAQISYEDSGLTARMLRELASRSSLPLQSAYELGSSMVEKELAGLRGLLSPSQYEAILQCVHAPGTLSAVLNLEEPTPLVALSMASIAAPQSLPINIICTPGMPVVNAVQNLAPIQ